MNQSSLNPSPLSILSSPFGERPLQRYPQAENRGQQQALRAWDSADEYLLQYLDTQITTGSIDLKPEKLLIINDSFGALTVSLCQYQPYMLSDSYLAHTACQRNLMLNKQREESVTLLRSFHLPSNKVDVILIKIPKTLALLEDQLYRLRSVIHKNTHIVAAGMVKHIHTSTLKLFESILGPTTTSLAQKKSRLIYCQPEPAQWQGESSYPTKYMLEATDFTIVNHANVFSRASLDIGTRLFLQHLPSNTNAKDIVDLGCGNGVVGLMVAAQNPAACMHFYDESYMALASAQENMTLAFGDKVKTHYCVGNGLELAESNSVDLVFNNPPFHQQNVVGDFIAWQMFKDSKRVLRDGGEMFVVGNRHMNYHQKLERLFGNCQLLASNKKFVILKSVKV